MGYVYIEVEIEQKIFCILEIDIKWTFGKGVYDMQVRTKRVGRRIGWDYQDLGHNEAILRLGLCTVEVDLCFGIDKAIIVCFGRVDKVTEDLGLS
jgi:hypothetical protein